MRLVIAPSFRRSNPEVRKTPSHAGLRRLGYRSLTELVHRLRQIRARRPVATKRAAASTRGSGPLSYAPNFRAPAIHTSA